jgi:hypothetical protein
MAKKEEKKIVHLPEVTLEGKKISKKKSITKDLEVKPNFGETLAVNLSFEELIKLSVSMPDGDNTSDIQKVEKTLKNSKKGNSKYL